MICQAVASDEIHLTLGIAIHRLLRFGLLNLRGRFNGADHYRNRTGAHDIREHQEQDEYCDDIESGHMDLCSVKLVAEVGFDPTTCDLWGHCSTGLNYPARGRAG